MYHRPTQRFVLGILLFCFSFVFIFSVTLAPRVVQAQLVVSDPPLEADVAARRVELSVSQSIWASAIVGVVNAVTLFAQQFAYDLAVGLASGAAGQNPFAFLESPGDYFTKNAYDAAGEFIGNLAGPWAELGLDLCNPRIPDIGLAISLGLAQRFQRPTPKCDFVQTINNWQNVVREVQDPHALLKHVSLAFDPAQTDIGQAFRAQEAFRIQVAQKQQAGFTQRIEGGGILPQSSLISGSVTTPAEVMGENFRSLARKGEKSSEPPTATELLGAVGGGDVWVAVGTTVLSTFVNTLISRMLQVALQGLFSDSPIELPNLADLVGSPTGAGSRGGGGARAVGAAVGLLTPQIRTATGAYDFVTELAACPRDREFATQLNCSIDQQFMVAIQRATTGAPITVQEAVDAGFLSGSKPFGYTNPSATPAQEPDYTEGYSYSAMKKLRLLRIIPVGWEFAALKIKSRGQPATLQDVLDGWNDSASDFYGLVDPNWALKAPVAQCGATVWSELLDAAKTGRQEVCADIRHCISQDEVGNCSAWGYCTRERNIWRFDGDPCNPQYASCETFKPKGRGAAVSVLENTLNFGPCNAENAGCSAYATAQNPESGAWLPSAVFRYLDSDVGTCTAAEEGCTEFVKTPSANLIKNPGFEKDEATPAGAPDDWVGVPVGVSSTYWSSDGAEAFEGRGALYFTGAGIVKQEAIPIQGGLTYTISLSAKGGSAAADQAKAFFTVRDESGAALAVADEATTCTVAAPGQLLQFSPFALSQSSTQYTRHFCTFTAPVSAVEMNIELSRLGTADVTIDAVQLEAGAEATDFREGYGAEAEVEKAYYRIPPDYLECTGEVSDRPECASFSRFCRREEVGCERYSPQNGDPAIPGVVTALDRCPENGECDGYATYLKQKSRFEPVFAGEGLYPLIPARAISCSALEAGCDEFTNLRTEAREYYSDLRACQTPGPTSQTYFTWEGSDTAGYQLKTWSLKRSNAVALSADTLASGQSAATAIPPCTNYAVRTSSGGAIVVDCQDTTQPQAGCSPVGPSLTAAQRADCRAFYDERGNIFYRFMNRTIFSSDECQSFRWTGLPALPEVSPASGETLDALRVRLEQEACNASDGYWDPNVRQCLYLGIPALSSVCSAQVSGCRGFKGNTGSNVETLFEDAFESSSGITGWSAAVVSGGTDPSVSISSEALTQGEHSARVATATQNEGAARSLRNPGGATPLITPGATYFLSLNVKGTATGALDVVIKDGSAEDSFTVGATKVPLTPDWRYLELGPLTLQNINAAAVQSCSLRTDLAESPTACSISGVEVCTVPTGLTSCTYLASPELQFRNSGTSPITFFVDNVIVKEVQDTLYLAKYSWDIPTSCDTLPEEAGGGALRGARLGCRGYTDRASVVQHLKSFTSLCREQSVGCQALADTQGSDYSWAQAFNNTENSGVCRGLPGDCFITIPNRAPLQACHIPDRQAACSYGGSAAACPATPATDQGCSYLGNNIEVDDVTVPDDRVRFVVVNPTFSCPATQKGCKKLGKSNSNLSEFEDKWLKDDPNQYARSLCRLEELECSAWQRTDNSPAYFRDPGLRGCTWKTNLKIGWVDQTSYNGWFRKEKQEVDSSGFTDTEKKCKGYGTWNSATKTCVDSAANSVTSAAGDPGYVLSWPASCNPGACGGTTCARCANVCNLGAGGTWAPAPGGSGGKCVAETPCYGRVSAGTTTVGTSTGVPVVELTELQTYLVSGTTLGIWNNSDARYANRAGECPPDQATCSEFIDPTDKTLSRKGASYFFKENTRLTAARAACSEGKASRKAGCILFDKTDDPQKRWNAQETYTRSDAQGGELTAPAPLAGQNDTNVVLKVKRDRECAEWFNCASAQWIWSEAESKFTTVCAFLSRCNELLPTSKIFTSTLTQCGRWNPKPSLSFEPYSSQATCVEAGYTWNALEHRCDITTVAECADVGGVFNNGRCELGILKAKTYRLRDRRFQGQEYTGYSIPYIYAIDQLQEVNVGTGSSPDYRLGHVLLAPATCVTDAACGTGKLCTAQGKCVESTTGARLDNTPAAFGNTTLNNQACRGYPERESPFPNTDATNGSFAYGGVTKCLRTGAQCACNYRKGELGGKRFYAPTYDSALLSICVGGTHDGKLCTTSGTGVAIQPSTCTNNGGQCQTANTTTAVGWTGYCLDRDPSRRINADQDQSACLTWLPVDRLSSAGDIYNQFVTAGYQLPTTGGGRYYCLFAGGNTGAREVTVLDNVNVRATDDGFNIYTFNVGDRDIYRYDIQSLRINPDVEDGSGPSPSVDEVPLDEDQSNDRHRSGAYWHAWSTLMEMDANWWWGGDDNAGTTGSGRRGDIPHLTTMAQYLLAQDANGFTNPDGAVDCEDTFNGDFPETYDGAAVVFIFNESQKLTKVRVGHCNAKTGSDDGDFESGLGPYDEMGLTITMRTHAHCSEVVEVDTSPGSPGSAPYTNRLWSAGNFTILHRVGQCVSGDAVPQRFCSDALADIDGDGNADPVFVGATEIIPAEDCATRAGRGWSCSIPSTGVDYNYDTVYPAFGTSSDALVSPTDAAHPWFLNHNRLDDSDSADARIKTPFAGWPFACEATGGDDYKQCTVRAGGVTDTATVPIDADGFGPNTLTGGVASLQQLFAKTFKEYLWDPSGGDPLTGEYDELSGGPQFWDTRPDAGNAPRVVPVGNQFGGLEENPLGGTNQGVSLASGGGENKFATGDVITGTDGFLPVSLKFFAYAHTDQMPIRRIAVAWGDGNALTGQGMYRNARGKSPANTSNCDSSTFGGSDGACFEGFYQYDYVYTCDTTSVAWKAGDTCPVEEFSEASYNGCCVYRPAVQVTDNWGWCSGGCVVGGTSGPCYGTECNADYDQSITLGGDYVPVSGYTVHNFPEAWIEALPVIAIAPRVQQ